MLQSGDSVLVGVSGGPDSVTLLHVLHRLAPRLSIKLGVAHLNHGLRQKDSDRDADFVIALAGRLQLPCFLDKADVREVQRQQKLSLEEAARQARYNFYHRIAQDNRFNKIATAHHRNDNAELILMYLIRGSGRLGLAGIPPVRDEVIIRPLIRISRSEIIDFLNSEGLDYVIDISNLDPRFLRNKIRSQLIPLLEDSYQPAITRVITRLAAILRNEDEWIETVLKPIYQASVFDAKEDKIVLSIPKLKDIHSAACRRIIRTAIAGLKGDLRRISFKHIDAATKLISGPSDRSLDLPGRIKIKKEGDRLIFSKEKEDHRSSKHTVEAPAGRSTPADYEYTIEKPGTILIKEINRRIKFSEIDLKERLDFHRSGPAIAFFDMESLSFPMVLRNFRPGDRFSPLGLGGTQKIKNYFINNKIPRSERSKHPLLVSAGRVVWIAGHRIDDTVKVVSSTQKVLKGELLLA